MKQFKTPVVNQVLKRHLTGDLSPEMTQVIDALDNYFQEKVRRNEILENCIKVSSEEIGNYIQKLEERTLMLNHSNKLSAIGEMSSSLSHEINNPLAVILSSSEIIEFLLESEDFSHKSQILDSLSRINFTVEKIQKITSSLKKISNENSTFTLERKNLKEVVQEACSFCVESLKNNGISINFNLNPEVYYELPVVEFSQVLINLITNAKHAVEKLSPNQKFINVDMQDLDSSIKVVISNGGPKVPAEIEDKIFDSFFTTKPVGQGSGLGLSISKKIIEKMKGKFYLDKEKDCPTFVIELTKLSN